LPIVQLIFRKNNPLFFSIEKVFDALMESIKKRISIRVEYMPFYSSSISNMLGNIRFVKKKSKADIYHVTGDVHYVVLGLPADRTILTIHDSVFIRDSKGLKQKFFIWMFLKLPVKHCRFITTISEKSKEEIIHYTDCDPSKVVVIPNPVNIQIVYNERQFNSFKPILLFIGSTPNKNLDRIIEALDGLSCTLKILGRIPEAHLLLLEKFEINFTQVLNLSETQMADCYSTSDVVIFPSLYEGFGLPILEGQKAGRAVVTSNISPMKEVAGEGACIVDPYDVASIRSGIKRLIEDAQYRERVIKSGFENIKKYETQAIADQYLKLYTAILDTKTCVA
jgi:glycosyltransferase involved in cell wall biosynthesis